MINDENQIDYNIEKIDREFLKFLKNSDEILYDKLIDLRNNYELDSGLIIKISLAVQSFLAHFFNIKNELQNYLLPYSRYKEIYRIKRNFLHRFVVTKYKPQDFYKDDNYNNLPTHLRLYLNEIGIDDKDHAKIDQYFLDLLSKEENYDNINRELIEYAAYRLYFGPKTLLFSIPEKQDFDRLIQFGKKDNHILKNTIPKDNRMNSLEHAANEALYCIKCHKTKKDSCSSGMIKNSEYGVNPLGNILSGCPLDIKISEMNEVFEGGNVIAALSIILLDNPLAVLTGKRICNDCSKACIYQKQAPVDIPSIESQILSDVLNFPYGFEIYYLLTQWNPLAPVALGENTTNGSALVVGSGPSAIALSYYLLKKRCKVVMIDGLKIEKISYDEINQSYKNLSDLKDLYQKIQPQGFGGVCEYGITERWNKENLILARLVLERDSNFQIYGGIKFGSNITYEQAKLLGFDHIALCCGSGSVNIPLLEHIDSGNVRTASDFLMYLSSRNFKSEADFIIELPAYVLGAGLTGVDAATEIIKYYPTLAKKIASKKILNKLLTEKDIEQYKRFEYASILFEAEDNTAKIENRNPDYRHIIKKLGGVYLCYRKNIEKSPSYRINHEELEAGLEAGFEILENTEIRAIHKDVFGNISTITLDINGNSLEKREARTLLIASGTIPLSLTDMIEQEYEDISIFGDMNKNYSGSVVKALKSAKDGYGSIVSKLKQKKENVHVLNEELFISRVEEVIHHNNDIFELRIKCPLGAKNYKPGQFFKLQNFARSSSNKIFKPIALSPYFIEGSIISFMIKKVGEATSMAYLLRKGEDVSLTGPVGKGFELHRNSKILLLGEGIGAFSLIEYAKLLQNLGNEVIFLCQQNEAPLEQQSKMIYQIVDIISHLKTMDLTNIEHIHIGAGCDFLTTLLTSIKIRNPRGSINTYMQCMMGGVCGQCFMKLGDKVEFMCRSNEQILNENIVSNLKVRLLQNSLLKM